jgi:L-proline---[L-prolyl-carrier protein] ligase
VKLDELVREQARRSPGRLAVSGPDGQLTYGELDREANALASFLAARGVRPGDRVALWLPKSTRAVAVMQAVLRLGAAYVPVDPLGPVLRTVRVVQDCTPRVVVTTAEYAGRLRQHGIRGAVPCPEGLMGTDSFPDPGGDDPGGDPGDLAYILYTSGSTGAPKGVCLSHRNALAFVDWAATEIDAGQADRFANHAPFHFDLSVLDLYAAFQVGASVHLIPADMSFTPDLLVGYLLRHKITVWYSVPSALILMMRDGGMLDVPKETFYLRALLYAGEPFPVKYLRLLRNHLAVRMLNLYGPTETNVCAFYEVTSIPADQVQSVPIGRACSGDLIWAVRADGTLAGPGQEGELVVSGPTVMLGYWGQPRQDGRPYRTGDRVAFLPSGDYQYLGRSDGMVKVRGHRVEVGEIEAALHAHQDIAEVAVQVCGAGVDAKIVAYVVPAGDVAPNILHLKRCCAAVLPRHMIIDAVRYVSALPRTGNGKLDRRSLASGLVPDLGHV